MNCAQDGQTLVSTSLTFVRKRMLGPKPTNNGEQIMAQTPRQPSSPEAQAAKLQALLESAVTAIITIDDRGLIEIINPATERLFGYGTEELIGQNVKMLMPEPYTAEHDGYIANYLSTGVKKIIGLGGARPP
jgi:PAS domain-containing protein